MRRTCTCKKIESGVGVALGETSQVDTSLRRQVCGSTVGRILAPKRASVSLDCSSLEAIYGPEWKTGGAMAAFYQDGLHDNAGNNCESEFAPFCSPEREALNLRKWMWLPESCSGRAKHSSWPLASFTVWLCATSSSPT